MVYLGRWFVIYDWCNILSVAAYEVFTCGVALVCNRGQCVFLLCGVVWVYFGFVRVCNMPYEYKKNENIDKDKILQNNIGNVDLEFPYACDGCDERCRLSVNLRAVPTETRFCCGVGSVRFKVVPEMYAGDKKLFEFPVNRPNVYYPHGCNLTVFQVCGDTSLCLNEANDRYKSALVWCRKNCAHSKLR